MWIKLCCITCFYRQRLLPVPLYLGISLPDDITSRSDAPSYHSIVCAEYTLPVSFKLGFRSLLRFTKTAFFSRKPIFTFAAAMHYPFSSDPNRLSSLSGSCQSVSAPKLAASWSSLMLSMNPDREDLRVYFVRSHIAHQRGIVPTRVP